jgi:hypothetical protein
MLRAMHTPHPRRIASAVGLALLLVLTACADDSKDSSKVASLDSTPGDGSSTATTVAGDSQEAILAFAACMRDNGIDMQDPTFDANGNATGGGLFGAPGGDNNFDPSSDEFQTAIAACQSFLDGVQLGGGPGGGGGFNGDAIQAALNDFTACLRDEGLDVDDITFAGPGGPGGGGPDNTGGTDNSFPPGGFNGGPPGSPPDGVTGGPGGAGFDPTQRMIEQLGLDDTDPAVASAIEACQSFIDNAFQPPTTEG